jgi:hypothetical protein
VGAFVPTIHDHFHYFYCPLRVGLTPTGHSHELDDLKYVGDVTVKISAKRIKESLENCLVGEVVGTFTVLPVPRWFDITISVGPQVLQVLLFEEHELSQHLFFIQLLTAITDLGELEVAFVEVLDKLEK